MTESITVASESQLAVSLIVTNLSRHFDSIESTSDPRDFFEEPKGRKELLLWDISDPSTCVTLIREARSRGIDTHNVMLVLQSDDQFDALHDIVGDVGAVLQPPLNPEAIANAALAVTKGMCFLPSRHAKRMFRRNLATEEERERIGSLTKRERAVLKHLSSGASDKSIAAAMCISDSTVRVHVRSVLRKLGAKNRLQAALHAVGAASIQNDNRTSTFN